MPIESEIEAGRTRKLRLPKIESVALVDFDLYTENPNASVEIDRSVFCLIGANGLGKTTFLNTLNFAITGALPNTSKKFQSDKKYLKDNSQPAKISDYFGGRISEEARSTASVAVRLSWADKRVTVRRSLFDDCAIIELSVSDATGHSLSEFDDLQAAYEGAVLAATGLTEFAQFVFLVHYVWTFDEGRHLLMWDEKALTDVLYLAFGGDPSEAQMAAKLRADIERLESNARNSKYAAKQLNDQIKVLGQALEAADEEIDDSPDEELLSLREHYDGLIEDVAEKNERKLRKQSELQDADLKWSELSSQLSEVQIEYQRVFNQHFQKTSSIAYHPIVRASLSEDKCAICHTNGTAAKIQEIIDAHQCPLCGSDVQPPSDGAGKDRLKTLDQEIADLQQETRSVLQMRERLSAEFEASKAALSASSDALKDFEDSKPDIELNDANDASADVLRNQISNLEQQGDVLIEKSEDLYEKRDAKRKELRVLEKALRSDYDRGASEFVPRFRELAESFIGKPIDIQINEFGGVAKSGFGLSLLMDGQIRLQSHTVSESQGFFIDIALRMSLAEFMSETPATLLIDTPEGSLDIAYEARAGTMFSNFVGNDNFILMTANLRSSELVLRLAQRQTSEGMQVVRMTEWTELSEVQKEEEALFSKSYDAIEAALHEKA